ncbi:G-type lectin S-receptor-like serine/threonine-protein kinase LECRK1 [Zingiber officinale]|uniref:G-type lectin S-receptor-like serine/threonine-protein kinase LECRK1 n=1 Tax=Zingiber officinale TaxID=94328 RepID=UPI001C4ACA24|nr:G-type lectin S-receptor-like serine/threonine-protein kinase LECRK1 [Zingiber officinale]
MVRRNIEIRDMRQRQTQTEAIVCHMQAFAATFFLVSQMVKLHRLESQRRSDYYDYGQIAYRNNVNPNANLNPNLMSLSRLLSLNVLAKATEGLLQESKSTKSTDYKPQLKATTQAPNSILSDHVRQHADSIPPPPSPPPVGRATLISLAIPSSQPVAHANPGLCLQPCNPNTGDFAFGFFPADSNRFLLAVWFNSTSPKSVVWSANRNALLASGATVNLTADGRISLRDENGTETWTTPGGTNAVAASVLDTGNLVLADATGGILWQSFEHPTDTLLPGQVLPANSSLRSQITVTDFSEGRFSLVAQNDGKLVLCPLALPIGNQYPAYWSVNISGAGNELVYNANGSIYYSLGNGATVPIIPGLNYPPQSVYQLARLDPDGVFRQYVYPKNNSTWNVTARVPEDICRTLVADNAGSGVCGYNSYCSSGDGQSQINCTCLPQYSFIDPDYEYKGCKPNFTQTCDRYDPNSFMMHPVDDLDSWYFDYEYYGNVDEGRCRDLCLGDCFCALAVYWDGDGNSSSGCFKKKLPLTYGHSGSYVNRLALIKVPNNNSVLAPFERVLERQRPMSVVGRFLLGSSGSLNLILIGSLIAVLAWHRRNRAQYSVGKQRSLEELNLRAFSYKELEQATKEFKEELGRGSFGVVYKGELLSSSGSAMLIAVKRLDRLRNVIDDDGDKEFTNEVRSIGKTYHKNLVRLIGYCHEESQRLLVYEYMSRGSLQGFLFGGERPPWEQRASIAIGIARGLMYLHEECSAPIIHCDIKPQNVLLDDNLTARISDFGLAKLLRTDQTRTNTGIRGTKGYVAPEWFKSVAITKKVDVYSFGVMLLEIVSCRKNLEMEKEELGEAILVDWAYDCYKDGKLELLLRDDEDDMEDRQRAERFATVALWCIQEDPALRPSISAVVQMLDGAIPVAVPPDPSTAVSSRQ